MLWRAGDVIYRAYSQRLAKVSSPYAAFGPVICALLIVSFYTSISGILKAEMFPAQVRALGVGLSLCRRERIVRRLCGVRRAVA